MFRIFSVIGIVVLAVVVGARVAPAIPTQQPDYRKAPPLRVPADNRLTPERVTLGKALFFDPRLSGSKWISCASCHNPALGWSDGLPTAIGNGMNKLKRATPTIVNVAFAQILMWDGREGTLESQALGPMKNKDEMGLDPKAAAQRLAAIPGYRRMFARAYPGEGITPETIGKAIASFERTVVSTDTPFDRWQAGDNDAVNAAAKRGFEIFRGRGKCDVCHEGYNFTDDGFHNIGVKTPVGLPQDVGRYAQRKVKSMKGAFKTPTLRDIALTGPYMHNGIYQTLEQVVEHYDRGGDVTDNLDPNMSGPLHLTDREKTDLVAFMQSLTGRPLNIAIPRLPQ
jgi:cytochrome c peroxidase